MIQILCVGCNRTPSQIPEYVECAKDENTTPDLYVTWNEGTFNADNGHFLCTGCYVKAGMPSSPHGWTAP